MIAPMIAPEISMNLNSFDAICRTIFSNFASSISWILSPTPFFIISKIFFPRYGILVSFSIFDGRKFSETSAICSVMASFLFGIIPWIPRIFFLGLNRNCIAIQFVRNPMIAPVAGSQMKFHCIFI